MGENTHRVVMRLLRSRILRGTYEGRMPGERQLAAEFHVDASTISMALIQLEAVGLIERRLRSGTFVVPQEQREKTAAPMSVVFCVTPESSSKVTYAFGQAAQKRGLEMSLVLHENTELDKATEEILARLKSTMCVGACIMDYPTDAAHALRLAAANGPVVLVDWETPDLILPTINYDNREAGRMAAAHLLRLGHRNILLADPIPADPPRTARREGVAELVRQAGGTFRERRAPDFTWGSPPCVEVLRAPDRPTAVICGAHGVDAAMATAAASLGLSVPGDLSVLCLDNIFVVRESEMYTHTVFDQTALGAGALELLLDSTPGEEPRSVLVPVRLDDRQTTAPPPTASK